MPAIASIPRCQRCATLIRNDRSICPSCGHTVGAPLGIVAAQPAKARTNMRICPICTKSVLASELVEHDNQHICAGCAEALRAKAQKRKVS